MCRGESPDMSIVEIKIDELETFIENTKNERNIFHEAREAITEETYDGMGKVADIMDETTGICDSILDCLDELYGRGITLMNYIANTMKELEETITEIL